PVAAPLPPPPPPAAAAPPLELDGFDIAGTLRSLNGDDRLLRKLLRSFATSNADLTERVRLALEAGEVEAAFRLVHGVKGTAGNLGATDLFKAAAAFHATLKARAKENYASQFEVFRQRMGAALGTLAVLEPSNQTLGELVPVDGPKLVEDCLNLANLLDSRKMTAVTLADKLMPRLRGKGLEQELAALGSALDALDFKTGHTVAQAMADKLRAE
ncbi:MAG: Hpt domain-containing protein, partial [Alphaproteobacteria bacterium]